MKLRWSWPLVMGLVGVLLASLPAKAGASRYPRVPGRITITLRAGLQPSVAKAADGVTVDVPALQALARRYAVRDMARAYPEMGAPKRLGEPDLTRFWHVDFDPARDLDEVLAAYAALPEVEKAEAIDICPLLAIPNDPQLSGQWYLRNLTTGGKDVRAVGGWAEAVGDTNIVIAIVDSGVDWQHPDLGGSAPGYRRGVIWSNWEEVYGTAGVDDDANGKIDDTRGWDFVTGVTGEPGQDLSTPDNDPMDFESHGTGCAGVASAITNNGTGIAGAAWGCKIMPVRVGWLPAGAEVGVVRMDFCSQGMIYAAANGAKIINCSWGSTSYLSSAVDYCVSQGVLIVTAAGNDNDEVASYLGSHPDVLAVAATNQYDVKTSFSSYGPWVELSAPGIDIYTTWYQRSTGAHTYNTVAGTSFSSPLTCGAAALVWSAHPGWPRELVMSHLQNTADNLDAFNPAYAGKLGTGRVNLLRALGDRIHEVPEEFPEFFDAFNECAPGDTIAVRSTTALTGPISVPGKALWLLGGWNAGLTARDPVASPTVITASAGSALSFQSGAAASTIVDGFRCTGGTGQLFSSPVSGQYGGGIVCANVSPTLRNLDVTGNSVGNSSTFGGGGGILLLNSNAVLENVRVHGNTAVHGGGIYAYLGAPSLAGCSIYDNAVVTDNGSYPPKGGGLYIIDAQVSLDGCEISGHQNVDTGGGIYAANYLAAAVLSTNGNEIHHNQAKTKGAGLFMSGATLTMKGDLIHDNGLAAGATFMSGGGFQVESASAILDSVVCQANAANLGGGGSVAGTANLTLRNCVLSGNSATLFGGALNVQQVTTGAISGNTIAGNSGGLGGGGLYLNSCSPAVSRNLIALNTGGATFANGIHANAAAPALSCNDVWSNDGANYGGVADPTGTNGNVSVDPRFCGGPGGEYALAANSPCLPASSGGCDLIGALGQGCGPVAVGDETPGIAPFAFRVEPAVPNPFNPRTAIRFTLPAAGRVTVAVYDVAGRLVRTLLDEDRPAGAHAAVWNGLDEGGRAASAGVYFYRVECGTDNRTGRMALVK